MIEAGIVSLVNGDAGVAAILNGKQAGFAGSLPKNAALPSWAYRRISLVNHTSLLSADGSAKMMLELNCYGVGAGDAISLGRAVNAVLNGYRGTLTDPDSTWVDSCFLADVEDYELDPDARNFRRRLEYKICFALNA